MKLVEGTKVFLLDDTSPSLIPRVELSSGTICAEDTIHLELYAEDSFVPRLPWRRLTDSEVKLVICDSNSHTSSNTWISVFSVPEEVMASFTPIREGLASRMTLSELRQFNKLPEAQTAISQAIDYSMTLVRKENPLIEAPIIHFSSPDMLTTTQDSAGKLIGLHIDSWYRMNLVDRNLAPNRLSINIGIEPRFLIFINLPLQLAAQILEQHYPEDDRRHRVGIGLRTAFMSNFPDYPVIKLRVEPGEAYIAPTENVIHDGCTLNQTFIDAQFNIRGHFLASTL